MTSVTSLLHYSAPLSPEGPDDDWVIDAVSGPEIRRNFRKVPVEVTITDLRGAEPQPSLDDAGFERVASPTGADQEALSKDDPGALARYQEETAALLRARTGADSVVVFDSTLRQEDSERTPEGPNQSAHLRVHVDQSPLSAWARAAHHGEPGREFRRFQILNVWRPLLEPVRNFPLALCDYRSLDLSADLVRTRLEFPAWLKDRENYSVKPNTGHRWSFWRSLGPEEALVFKCYDSASRGLALLEGAAERPRLLGVAGLCPHTAFLDPDGSTTGRLRTSLELRALLFYH